MHVEWVEVSIIIMIFILYFFSSASALSSQWEKRPNQYKWLINPIDSMTSLHMCKLTSVESMVECAGLSIILQIKHITMQKLLIIFPY